MYNTLLGYSRAGWDVHVVTDSEAPTYDLHLPENITIHRFPNPLRPALALLRRSTHRFGTMARALLRSKEDYQPRGNTVVRDNGSRGPLLRVEGRARQIVHRYSYRRLGAHGIQEIGTLGKVDLLYGYEVAGVHAALHVRRQIPLPLVMRYQGTVMARELPDPEAMKRRWPLDVEAMTQPCDLIIMANDGTEGDRVLTLLGVSQDRCRFWMNGVDKEGVFRSRSDKEKLRSELGLPEDCVLLLHSGRQFDWKRMDRHLEVLGKLLRKDRGFRAVFIGDGPEHASMVRQVAALGLQDHVILLGAMSHDAALGYMNACDIYISFYDLSNLSNSLIEACVCGKCIVTTAVGGTQHLVQDGVNAVVVSSHDNTDEIAAALLRVVRDPEERDRLAHGASRVGESIPTWKTRMEIEVGEVEALLRRGSLG